MLNEEQDPILYSNGSTPVKQADFLVSCSKSNNRTVLPDPLERSIDTEWASRCAANSTLWNGSKFRVASVSRDKNNNFTLNLGLTNYKDFLGTNLSSNAKHLLELGREQHGNTQAFMSDPLGVGAVLLTSDNYIVLLKRSALCGEAPGWYDIPGGHAEPEEITGKVDISDVDYSVFSTENLQKEIYQSVLREVRDEVNIPLDNLEEPLLMGLAINPLGNGRPNAAFLVRTSMTSEQVVNRYNDGSQAEAYESTDIKVLTRQQVLTIQQSSLWDSIASKGCVLLYQDFVEKSGI